jgi:histidyl-tRNA synthetase
MATQTPQRVRGTQDMFGGTAARFERVVDVFRRVARLYAFRPVQVPIFEATAVFARSLGETTDVVSKEMYSFEDRGGDSLTLRPELTAGIARAYLTEGWQQHIPLKVVSWGPAFRYERPQKGRFRQFHQLDAEVIGVAEPSADVELLAFGAQLLEELGVSGNVTLQLNTLGDAATRDGWRAALVAHFTSHRDALSEDSQDRLARNPLRILDSKDPRDRPLADAAPAIDDFLTTEAGSYFEQVQRGLDAAGVAWTRNPRLVRGLDYYRHTAFEFVTDALGAQGTVLAGGRYDGLIEALGGPPTPGVGWAAGIERLAMLIDEPAAVSLDVAVIAGDGDEATTRALAAGLRRAGLASEVFTRGNFKKQMARASASGARFAVIAAAQGAGPGEAMLKDLGSGEQRPVAVAQLAAAIVAA